MVACNQIHILALVGLSDLDLAAAWYQLLCVCLCMYVCMRVCVICAILCVCVCVCLCVSTGASVCVLDSLHCDAKNIHGDALLRGVDDGHPC